MGRGEGGERAGLLHCNQIQEKGREGQSSTYSVPTMCYALREKETEAPRVTSKVRKPCPGDPTTFMESAPCQKGPVHKRQKCNPGFCFPTPLLEDNRKSDLDLPDTEKGGNVQVLLNCESFKNSADPINPERKKVGSKEKQPRPGSHDQPESAELCSQVSPHGQVKGFHHVQTGPVGFSTHILRLEAKMQNMCEHGALAIGNGARLRANSKLGSPSSCSSSSLTHQEVCLGE